MAGVESASAEPLPGRCAPSLAPSRGRFLSTLATSGGVLCACALGGASASAEALGSPPGRNFVQVVAAKPLTPARNFVVIRGESSGSATLSPASLQSSPAAPQPPSERVILDDAKLSEYAAEKNLPLKPFYLHLSSRPGRSGSSERATVVGSRGGEVWRYELGGHARKVTRVGVVVVPTDRERAEHESAVVGSRVLFAFRPAKDAPTGEAVPESDAPLSVFVRTPDALFQVSRSAPDAFTITQVGVFDSDAP